MIFLVKHPLMDQRLVGRFKFITAHLFLDQDSAQKRNYVPVKEEINRKLDFLNDCLLFAGSHALLCIIHPRDYIIRDWRSVPILPMIHKKIKGQYLCGITLYDSVRNMYHGTKREAGNIRPYFPYRSTLEVTFYLLNRDSNATYENWESKLDASKTIKRVNVWRSERLADTFTPSPYDYKSLLDLFCHPKHMIYDPLPHHAGFAIAAADLGRSYTGIYNEKDQEQLVRRLDNVKVAKYEPDTAKTVGTPNRVLKVPKASRLLGWRRRVRKD
jgi:hypothetical protein